MKIDKRYNEIAYIVTKILVIVFAFSVVLEFLIGMLVREHGGFRGNSVAFFFSVVMHAIYTRRLGDDGD